MKLRLACGIALIGASTALNFGCAVHARVVSRVQAPPVVFTEPPVLVTVEPGVMVVRDSDYPVYFVDDSYWVYRDDVWYRSPSYDGGWIVADTSVVPMTIAHRDHRMFVRYHGAATAEVRAAPSRPIVVEQDREHRAEARDDRERRAEQVRGPATDRRLETERKEEIRRTPSVDRKAEERKADVERKTNVEHRTEADRRPPPVRRDIERPHAVTDLEKRTEKR